MSWNSSLYEHGDVDSGQTLLQLRSSPPVTVAYQPYWQRDLATVKKLLMLEVQVLLLLVEVGRKCTALQC
jgi:hypothetical protein